MSQIQDYIRTKLNDEQFAAAMHIDTSSLIIAGAWSGKTRALTYKIAYLMLWKKINPLNILAVTFTNKAANEMKERIMLLGEEMMSLGGDGSSSINSKWQTLDSENDSIDDFLNVMASSKPTSVADYKQITPRELKRIWTFHSVFLKILKEDMEKATDVLKKHFEHHKYTKWFTILDTGDSTSIVKDVLKKTGLKEVFKPNECKNFISKQKNKGITPKIFLEGNGLSSDYDQSMWKVYDEYQKALSMSNALDFDDLLMIPYLIFTGNPDILVKWIQQFRYIMVDEAQDTNWIQFELMKMMSGPKWNVTLIGDDYQSIYGRRWAIMENFLNVKKYRPDIKIFKLQINYRSRPHIVTAWNTIIKKNINQYEKNVTAHRTGEDKIILFSHSDETNEAANVVDLIKKMKWTKVKSRNDVAILYRTNAQSSPFEQILVQEWIPYKIHGAYKFFERKEVKDVIAYLNYFLNPQNNIPLKRIINVPSRKIWKTSISKIEEVAIINNLSINEVLENPDAIWFKIPATAKKWLAEFQDLVKEMKSEREKLSPAEFIEKIIKKIHYRDYLVKEEWSDKLADEKYENIWNLINMAERYIETGESALRWFMEEVTLMSDLAENEKWDVDAIKLMTLHASKGLEFRMVFIVWLEDQIFPLANAIMEPALLEEERRLMYVWITRAENHLFLSYAHSRMQRWQTKMNPPSRFIEELPSDLLKKHDLSGTWSSKQEESFDIEAGDTVRHKLFWQWYVVETRNNLAIVKFQNPKFGLRKMEMRFLTIV